MKHSLSIVVLLVFAGGATLPVHGHSAYGHCDGPPALKADYPHETTYGGSPVVKGKVGGRCVMPHETFTGTCIAICGRNAALTMIGVFAMASSLIAMAPKEDWEKMPIGVEMTLL